MKQCDLTKGLVVFLTIMITLFCGLIPGSWAIDDDVFKCNVCANQSFKGCYGFSVSGAILLPQESETPVPVANVGVFYLDGKGNLTGHEVMNFGGTPFYEEISGTYTVNPDCTGTAKIGSPLFTSEGDNNFNLPPLVSTIFFVVNSEGKELQMMTIIMEPIGSSYTGDILPINLVGIAKKQSWDD